MTCMRAWRVLPSKSTGLEAVKLERSWAADASNSVWCGADAALYKLRVVTMVMFTNHVKPHFPGALKLV